MGTMQWRYSQVFFRGPRKLIFMDHDGKFGEDLELILLAQEGSTIVLVGTEHVQWRGHQ